MSIPDLPPTAPTTLLIMLGASAWPRSPGFQSSEAFENAAQGFKDYMLDSGGFGLPKANLLDLFNRPEGSSDQLEDLGCFLEERIRARKTAGQEVRDVLVYFIGHGGFAGPSADFYLMHRRADASNLMASGIAINALAQVLREKARQTRLLLFLDCCFAAAAFHSFQGGPDQVAITKTLDAFSVQARGRGFPRKGIVLLCSSDQKTPSLLLPDKSSTMFSHALLDVLRNGDSYRSQRLSLRDIKELAEDRLAALPEKNAPRPSLLSPDQSEGDVADVAFFPNPRTKAMYPQVDQLDTTNLHLVSSSTPQQTKKTRGLLVGIVVFALLLILGGSTTFGVVTLTGNAHISATATATFRLATARSATATVTAQLTSIADFTIQMPVFTNMILIFNNATFNHDHAVLSPNQQVAVTFPLRPNINTVLLSLRALVSQNGPNTPGYSPISIYCNNQVVVENYTIPGHGGSPNTTTIQIPLQELTQGSNQLRLVVASNAETFFWLYNLSVTQSI